MYTIILNNGTQLQNLTLNGNNFIAPSAIEDSIFTDNMAIVTIHDVTNDQSETIEDAVLLSNIVRDGKSWIVLGKKTLAQKEKEATEKEITELRSALNALLTGGN